MGCSNSIDARQTTHRSRLEETDVFQDSDKLTFRGEDSERNRDPILKGVKLGTPLYKQLTTLITNEKVFFDPDFPSQVTSITTNEHHPHYNYYKPAVWKRPPEIFDCPYDEIKLFDTIDLKDVIQGKLNNGYFMAALSAMAETPAILRHMFLNQHANKHGLYGLKFYLQGLPTVVFVDDYFPCFDYNQKEPVFAKPKGKELWTMIAEKAWAKVFKSYTATETGSLEETLENLTGAPCFGFCTKEQTEDETWQLLNRAYTKGYIMGATSDVNPEDSESTGLVIDQCYSIISVHEVEGHRLMKLRNPWGKFEWKGAYCDGAPQWTYTLKKAVDYLAADEGMFFITLSDFRRYFNQYAINSHYDNWQYTHTQVESSPDHAEYFRFSIEEPCEVYFRIHQADKRLLPSDQQRGFKYSPASFMVVQVLKDGSLKPIVENAESIDPKCLKGARSVFPSKSGKLQLTEPGDYIIRAKVKWRHGQKDKFTLSAYSPFEIALKQTKPIKDYLSKYFTYIARQNETKHALTDRSFYVIGNYGGHVYASVENWDHKQITVDINFTSLENMKLGKPYKETDTQLKITVPPGSQRVAYVKVVDSTIPWNYQWDTKFTEH